MLQRIYSRPKELALALFVATAMVFIVLPLAPEIGSAAKQLSLKAASAVACCGGGDDGGGGGGPSPMLLCTIESNKRTVDSGESFKLTWKTIGYGAPLEIRAAGKLLHSTNKASGSVTLSHTVDAGKNPTWDHNVVHDGKVICKTPVTIKGPTTPPPPAPKPSCSLSINKNQAEIGENFRVSWNSNNATQGTLTLNGSTIGNNINLNGSRNPSLSSAGTYTYRATFTNDAGQSVSCSDSIKIVAKPVAPKPTCSLSINKSQVAVGESFRVSWNSNNATQGTLTLNGSTIGNNINLNGSRNPSLDSAGTYTYRATFTNDAGQSVSCSDSVKVVTTPAPTPQPTCTLAVNPKTIEKGDMATLSWTTKNADTVSINQGIGSVSKNGSRAVGPNSTTSYILTAKGDGGTVQCSTTVTVKDTPDPKHPTCSLSINKSHVDRGESFTVSWNSSNATGTGTLRRDGTVIDSSIPRSGSRTQSLDSAGTYTYRATFTNDAGQSVSCSDSIVVEKDTVTSDPRPSCDLFRASRTFISAGESVELRWETRRGDRLTIRDNRGNEIFYTTSSRTIDSGDVIVRPVRDTRYTLEVEHGSRRDTCTTHVDVRGQDITFISDRDQQPLTSISLTQVPYTGFDAGPFLTSVFYGLIALWSMALAYVFVIKRRRTAAVAAAAPAALAPSAPAESMQPLSVAEHTAQARLEAYAHRHHTLLSNDAVRFLIDAADSTDEAVEMLDAVMERAHASGSNEDGWVTLNRAHIAELFSRDA